MLRHSIIFLFTMGVCFASKKPMQQRVILISIDGFRFDYKDYKDYRMENLNKMIKDGVTVDYVKNVFPTNTYPNHQSIITGRYPEEHGIIDNRMFDPNNGTIFEPGVTDNRWWNQAEPLWVTNQKQGYLSGTGYWPGSDVKFDGILPKYSFNGRQHFHLMACIVIMRSNIHDFKMSEITLYNKCSYIFLGSMPFVKDGKKSINLDDRVDQAVCWLRKDKNLTFEALYFEEPDKTTHGHGADSNNTKIKGLFKTALSKIDLMLGRLISKLKEANLLNETNVILIGKYLRRKIVFQYFA